MSDIIGGREAGLPKDALQSRSGWWGMVFAIVTEASIFAYLLFSYFYVAAQVPASWPPDGLPSLKLALPNTIVLILSSLVLWWSEHRGTRDRARRDLGILITLCLGLLFAAVQLVEWRAQPFSISSHVYGSLFFTITGFHLAHVVAGLVMLVALLVWARLDYFDRPSDLPLPIVSIYWHFVDVVWIAVFLTFYATPYLG